MDGSDDLEALMTGIYGSAVPCLCTYPNEVSNGHQVAQIATTLRDGKGTKIYLRSVKFNSLWPLPVIL